VNRMYVRAGVATAAVALGLWVRVADPGWVQAAGLDVWNAARLEGVVRDQQALAERLDDGYAEARHRARVNEALARDVAAGRRPLAAAAADLWEANRDVPGFATVLGDRFRCPTPVAACARLLLLRVERDEGLPPASRFLALERLRAEYADEFGHPVPRAAAVVPT
jgi:hypothetical protein